MISIFRLADALSQEVLKSHSLCGVGPGAVSSGNLALDLDHRKIPRLDLHRDDTYTSDLLPKDYHKGRVASTISLRE